MSAQGKSYSVRIRSTGLYLPGQIVDNAAVVERVKANTPNADFLTPEWIEERVGIRTRRRFLPDENLIDTSCDALRSALEKAEWAVTDLDFIILASISMSLESDGTIIPAMACRIQERVGAYRAFAYDLVAACSGFIYGMAQAVALIESGMCERGALICSESQDPGLDYADPTSCILIGDVSTATLFEKADEPLVHGIILEANDEKQLSSIIDLPYGGYFSLEGKKVYKEGVRAMRRLTADVVEQSGYALDDVDWFIYHQANLLMLQSIEHGMQIQPEKNLKNIMALANTTAGTIPSVLSQYVDDGTIKRGDKIVFTAFGGGLTAGSILVTF